MATAVAVTPRSDRWWALAIGTGLALSPIHNVWLTQLTTNDRGETLFFLPAFGYLVLIMSSGLFLVNHWERVKAAGWGDKRVVGCLLFIVLAMALSGSAYNSLEDKVAPLGMGLVLLALYMAGRVLGPRVFLPFWIGSMVACAGVFAYAALHPGSYTGGYVFETNFDILVGYVLLGAALCFNRLRWVVASIALLAMVVSGAPEALLPLGVIGIAVLARRDWSRRTVYAVAPTLAIAVLLLATGHAGTIYSYIVRTITGDTTMVAGTLPDGEVISGQSPLSWRWEQIRLAMTTLQPLGAGYNATAFTITTVHNVPLILVQQMGYPGILAALAWLYVTFFALVKTPWRYFWLLVLALSVFDHYLWDQLGPVWWLALGAASSVYTKTDTVFRRE